jgi:hypothetical protein
MTLKLTDGAILLSPSLRLGGRGFSRIAECSFFTFLSLLFLTENGRQIWFGLREGLPKF